MYARRYMSRLSRLGFDQQDVHPIPLQVMNDKEAHGLSSVLQPVS